MEQIFLDIQEQLTTIDELNWIDADEGQLDFFESKPPVDFPAALIDIDYVRCEDITDESQTVTARIKIRYAFMPMGETNAGAPVSVRNNALKRFETLKKTYNKLQGFETDTMSALSRVSQTTVQRDDNLKEIEQIWETTFEESVDE